MRDALYLGPFELGEVIQSGGMAKIHRGVHRYSGELAAIKVIKPDQLSTTNRRRALRREIQTIAGLDHPHIVRLYDLGEVDAQLGARSQGILPANAPWYAMEFVNGGSLLEAPPPQSWSQIKRWLLELLDALAHAHAGAVIHRDLKPGNILLDRDADGIERIKLVDFGIAQLVSEMEAEQYGEQTSEINVSGTPRYMAPEQVSGRHREQGPWTDLYSFGCVAWFLLCGMAPFGGTLIQIMHHHVYSELPEFSPLFPIPRGFEEWLRQLLAKSPHQRFRRAADAARALVELGEPRASTPSTDLDDDDPTIRIDLTSLRQQLEQREIEPTSSLSTLSFLGLHTAPELDATAPPLGEDVPADPDVTSEFSRDELELAPSRKELAQQIPRDWSKLSRPNPALRASSSLGLIKLRTPPMIGREKERELLWTELRRAAILQIPSCVLLEARHGVGASRLATWIARRAHEVGAAIHLKTRHDPYGDALDGLRNMLTTYLRCAGLNGEKLRRHLKRVCVDDPRIGLEESDLDPLATLLEPPSKDARQQAAEFTVIRDQSARHELLLRLFARLGRERPVLLELDDAYWAHETLLLVEYLLHECAGRKLPMLIVCTVNTEQLREAPFPATILERLRAHPSTKSVTLEPLSTDEQRALFEAILPLKEDLTQELVRRTEGRPGFALELLDEWNRQGLLYQDVDGFGLREHGSDALPSSLQEMWERRLGFLFASLPMQEREDSIIALEVAATLGRHVQAEEWRAACMFANSFAHERCVDELLAQGLATASDTGWSFAHQLLQEALLAQATREGRAPYHHRHCAAMLETIYRDMHPRRLLRRAYHHHHGGEHEEAQRLLVAAARRFELLASYTQSLEALELRAEALEAIASPDQNPSWLHNELDRARLEFIIQRPDQALAKLDALESHPLLAASHQSPALSLFEHVKLLGNLENGNIRQVLDARSRILQAIEGAHVDRYLIDSLELVARAHELLGEIQTADQLHALSKQRYQQIDDPVGEAFATLGRISCALGGDDLKSAEQLLDRALETFSATSQLEGLFRCAWFETYICILKNRKSEARAATEAISVLLPQFDAPMRANHFIRLLLLSLELGDIDSATESVEEIARVSDSLDAYQMIHHQAALAAFHACKRAPGEAARRFEIVEASLRRIGLATSLLADALTIFARHVHIDHPEMRDRALEQARSIYQKLGSRRRLEWLEKRMQ